ncbi:MAG TPA: hypothetical protein VK841_09395 [Polyangiaceae bacterium]|jgi:hypothetical protein|nr:hypothetical protein [Polyangiaceae bacterium]
MTDRWGGLPLPLPSPDALPASSLLDQGDPPTTDPAIGFLLPFLQAFLVNDNNATAAWTVPGVSPSTPPVAATYPYDPRAFTFSSAALPALFAWREEGKLERISDETVLHESTLIVLWVFPLQTKSDSGKSRQPFVNGLVSAVMTAIERGRTPAWVQPGDDDPQASYAGSYLGKYIGSWSLTFERWKSTRLWAQGADGGRTEWPAIEMTMTLVEDQVRDITRNPPYFPLAQDTGVQITTVDGASGETTGQAQGFILTPWAPSTAYAIGANVSPLTVNGLFFGCIVNGTSGTSEPVWTSFVGSTVTDGSAIWICVGALPTDQ